MKVILLEQTTEKSRRDRKVLSHSGRDGKYLALSMPQFFHFLPIADMNNQSYYSLLSSLNLASKIFLLSR